jgi:hypothetical protein
MILTHIDSMISAMIVQRNNNGSGKSMRYVHTGAYRLPRAILRTSQSCQGHPCCSLLLNTLKIFDYCIITSTEDPSMSNKPGKSIAHRILIRVPEGTTGVLSASTMERCKKYQKRQSRSVPSNYLCTRQSRNGNR